jgi:hypothetical protein
MTAWFSGPAFARQLAASRRVGEFIAAIIIRMRGVPFGPVPVRLVTRRFGIQELPQVLILDRSGG